MLLFIKSVFFTLVAPGSLGVYLPWYLASGTGDPAATGALRVVAVALLAAGAAIYLRCAWDFAVTGGGTPAPIDAPRRLVVAGLYRHLRNPMYVGVVLLAVGWTVYVPSVVLATYSLVLAAGFHLFVIGYEEPALRRRFGDAYAVYCRQVHRWAPQWPSPIPG